jgi:hypothetical protein
MAGRGTDAGCRSYSSFGKEWQILVLLSCGVSGVARSWPKRHGFLAVSSQWRLIQAPHGFRCAEVGAIWRGLFGRASLAPGCGNESRLGWRYLVLVQFADQTLRSSSHPKDLACSQFDAFPAVQLGPDVQVEVQALAHQTLAFARVEVNHVVHVSSASVNDPVVAVER